VVEKLSIRSPCQLAQVEGADHRLAGNLCQNRCRLPVQALDRGVR